jgi:hypothetical protein
MGERKGRGDFFENSLSINIKLVKRLLNFIDPIFIVLDGLSNVG